MVVTVEAVREPSSAVAWRFYLSVDGIGTEGLGGLMNQLFKSERVDWVHASRANCW